MEKYIGILAALIVSSAQLLYIVNTVSRKITPSVLSWLGWACLMGTSFLSQVIGKGWQWSLTAILGSTIGCLAIAATAFVSKNFAWKKSDLSFLVVGLLCVAIYLFSSDPWITTIFAIIADAALGIPTLRKAAKDPATERSPAWVLCALSALLGLFICIGHDPIYFLFPGYLLLFNGTMVWLTRRVNRTPGVSKTVTSAGRGNMH